MKGEDNRECIGPGVVPAGVRAEKDESAACAGPSAPNGSLTDMMRLLDGYCIRYDRPVRCGWVDQAERPFAGCQSPQNRAQVLIYSTSDWLREPIAARDASR